MIEKNLRTGTGKLRVQIPGNLTEVTLGQMVALQEKKDLGDLDAISILSGIPVSELENVTSMEDFQVFTEAVLSLANQVKYLYNSDNVPKHITFVLNNKKATVNVISNLSVEPAGAFMAARNIIAEEVNESIKQYGEKDWQQYFNPSLRACSQVLAHYFFCRATGKKYNEYEAEEFCTEIKKLRVTEALPIAKHFFTSYPNLSKPRTNFFHRLQLRLKKGPGYRHLKSLSISTP